MLRLLRLFGSGGGQLPEVTLKVRCKSGAWEQLRTDLRFEISLSRRSQIPN
ncbi:hypothetical protein [Nostoc sp. FACHB-857]|uniref:Uncharacterized protein n=1 Tax=Nostoc paludosum FACHB-159 TaxID=2692908 RepID=A0ABR8KFC1_9NOSO|nr:hypothetical protein [Nostoc sp. FACHB-857]MBD2681262.1 hypothetical protein [Nostoc sp. FACHB-857]MBD2737740.1 hypothetical protein [Nostoc paludosum FACHB-159]